LVTDNPEPIETEGTCKFIAGDYTGGEVQVEPLFSALYRKHNIYSLLIEAGPRLLNQILRAGLVDELIVFESQTRFNNPTDRYRLDLSCTTLMEANLIRIDGADRITSFRSALY
jgi:riboflavin biosynthesis pyrimidine reductase